MDRYASQADLSSSSQVLDGIARCSLVQCNRVSGEQSNNLLEPIIRALDEVYLS